MIKTYKKGHQVMQTNKNLIRSFEIKGVRVKNMKDENLGEITEIMINKKQGKIDYVVVSFGGFLGIGDKFFAIPWPVLTYHPENDSFRVDISREEFKNSPGFSKDHWPDSYDPYWTETTTNYYL